jgi:hypothetical protein
MRNYFSKKFGWNCAISLLVKSRIYAENGPNSLMLRNLTPVVKESEAVYQHTLKIFVHFYSSSCTSASAWSGKKTRSLYFNFSRSVWYHFGHQFWYWLLLSEKLRWNSTISLEEKPKTSMEMVL